MGEGKGDEREKEMVWEGDEGGAAEKEWQESIVGDAERHRKEGLMERGGLGKTKRKRCIRVHTSKHCVHSPHLSGTHIHLLHNPAVTTVALIPGH